MSEQDQKTLFKQATKEAIREWLDAQFATFGKFSAGALISASLALLIYAILQANGWKPPTP